MDDNKELTEQQQIDAEIEKLRQQVTSEMFDKQSNLLDVSASDYNPSPNTDESNDDDDQQDPKDFDKKQTDGNQDIDDDNNQNADDDDDEHNDDDQNSDGENNNKQDTQKQNSEKAETFQITHGNQNYDLNLEQLKQLAPYAIEYQQFSNRVKPYMPFIEAIERDPNLGNAVINAVKAYKSSGNTQAQTNAEEDKEPEIGENEEYSAYEARLAKWKEEKQQRDFDRRLAAYTQHQQQQQQIAVQKELNDKVTQYVMADPDKDAVLKVISAPDFDPVLRQTIDTNGQLFMSVYDTIKRNLGLNPLFRAPAWGAVNNAQQPAKKTVNTVNQPHKKAPFAESGGNSRQQIGGVNNNNELPDVKRMSDSDFMKYQEQLKAKWLS